MQLPITIGLRRSRFLVIFLILSSLLASGAVLVFPRPMLILALILCLICSFTILAWRRLKPPVLAIRLEQSGEVSLLYMVNQPFVRAEILPGATVHPWLTIFRLRVAEKQPVTVIVTVDTLKAQNFRCLRVFLRWRATFNELSDDV